MLCPRWDSNRAPTLEKPPLPRKHSQSCPVRGRYNRIRSPGCAHCAHPLFYPLDAAPIDLMQSFERGECLSTARYRSASCHHFSGATRNPTRDPGQALMCGASRGLGFNERHSVATSFEPLMGEKTDKAMTRTSPYRASNSHYAQRVPERRKVHYRRGKRPAAADKRPSRYAWRPRNSLSWGSSSILLLIFETAAAR